ncbi:MAG: hypothetical protein DRP01_05835 [Archaeoglobales archaeon]|nr:MAG: hypothetical protein DRP01_05835 [Archaeoglobales archaeon]
MKATAIQIALLSIILLSFLALAPPTAKAQITTTKTVVFETTSYDTELYKTGTNYATVHDATSGTESTYTYLEIGQTYSSPNYEIYRTFLYFSTDSLPDNATLDNAILSIYIASDGSTSAEFNITIQSGAPTYPHIPIETTDYNYQYYSGDGGSFNTSEITTTGTYYNITLNSVGLGWINKSGYTKLCLRSSRDINNIAPTGYESVFIGSKEGGYPAKLYITYTATVWRYIFFGPYYEDGTACFTPVTVHIYSETQNPYTFTLDGDTETIDWVEPVTYITWNISDPTYNKTRVIYPDPTLSQQEIYIFVPNPDTPSYLYTFNVVDMVGVTDAYLETRINVNGTARTVERQKLDVVNEVPFWMMWSQRYQLRLTCNRGTAVWSFIALTDVEQTLLITPDLFNYTAYGRYLTVNATRLNSTCIQVRYYDPTERTTVIQVKIKHKTNTTTFTTDYTYSKITPTDETVLWNNADPETDYYVDIFANYYVASEDTYKVLTWNFTCPRLGATTNPWENLFTVLGTFPFNPSNLFGVLITLAVFAVFSYYTVDVAAFLAVLTAATLTYIGWLSISWTAITLAFTIAIFIALQHKKKRMEEI